MAWGNRSFMSVPVKEMVKPKYELIVVDSVGFSWSWETVIVLIETALIIGLLSYIIISDYFRSFPIIIIISDLLGK
jgi:hypothetical protein